MTKRNVTIERIYDKGMREPRPGELNFELRRILIKHCLKKPLKDALKSVQLAVSRVARQFGIHEFSVDYDRHASTGNLPKPWVNEGISVRMYRKRPNGTVAIHRVGASSYPHFFPKGVERYANLSAPRDLSIFYGIDDPYDWYEHSCKKPRASLLAKWKRNGRKLNAYKKDR
jgi:hypothetical protein